MSRSVWKGPHIENCILRTVNNVKKGPIKIWSRSSVIPGSLVGKTVLVYNGKEFKNVPIVREKVGFKFGDFCTTRIYTSKKKSSKLTTKKK